MSNALRAKFRCAAINLNSRASLAAVAGAALLLAGCATELKPLTSAESTTFTEARLQRLYAEQERVTGPISLYEAMARAIKYNLDTRVELAQTALRIREVDLAHYRMLPSLVASSGYTGRDKVNASSSESIITGRQSLEPSRSTERDMLGADLTLSWNVLDFGLSWVRAQQLADEALIADETRRRVANRVIEDVRTAYWRAVTAERLAGQMRALEGRVLRALQTARQQNADPNVNPVAALTFERDLVEVRRQIQQTDSELSVAKAQLAALINLTPGTPFRLVDMRAASVPVLRQSPSQMMRLALNNRPEMREVQYRLRINDKEMTAALLELLPGAQLFIGGNYDSNKFLFHNSWLGYGAKATWNLMKIFQYPARKATVDAQEAMLDQRAMALTMAIITQVHVSRAKYALAMRDLKTAADLVNVQYRLRAQMRSQFAADRAGEQFLIKEELNALLAEVRYDLAHAQLQNAFASVYGALGLDQIDASVEVTADTRTLARQLERLWRARGDAAGTRALALINRNPRPMRAAFVEPPRAPLTPDFAATGSVSPAPAGPTPAAPESAGRMTASGSTTASGSSATAPTGTAPIFPTTSTSESTPPKP